MEINTLVNLKIIGRTDKGFLLREMDINIQVNGKMVKGMVKVLQFMRMENLKKVFGIIINFSMHKILKLPRKSDHQNLNQIFHHLN